MDDLWVRLTIVGIVAGVAVSIALLTRRDRHKRGVRDTGLAEGVYLFSSVSCSSCSPVRERLLGQLGVGAFIELTWESQPDLFARLGVDQVPATLSVGPDGYGTWSRSPGILE